MSQLSFDVIKRVWPKSGLVTLFKKYSRIANKRNALTMFVSQGFRVHAKHYGGQQSAAFGLLCYMNN